MRTARFAFVTFTLSILVLVLAGTPASAAATFALKNLDLTVSGTSVTGRAYLTSSATTRVQRIGICVRDESRAVVDFAPTASSVIVSRVGTSYRSTKTFLPGTYRANVCLQLHDVWTMLGAAKLFTVAESTSNPNPKPSDGSTQPGPAVLFYDDFDGPTGSLPDQSKWRDYSGCADSIQAFGRIRCGNDETLTGNGYLSVPATASWGSGLSTAGKFGFSYGIISAWIKTPRTSGYWPAFWTENRPADFHKVPLYGEADALELYTFEPKWVHNNNIQAWGSNGQVWGGGDNYCSQPGVSDFGDTFHKYTIKFEPTQITGYVDGVQCGPVITKAKYQPWPFAPDVTNQNYLILDLAVGGAGDRQPTPTKPDVMLVDRVEVLSLAPPS